MPSEGRWFKSNPAANRVQGLNRSCTFAFQRSLSPVCYKTISRRSTKLNRGSEDGRTRFVVKYYGTISRSDKTMPSHKRSDEHLKLRQSDDSRC